MSTFSQTTFRSRSSPVRTSNVGSPSPTRSRMRYFDGTVAAAVVIPATPPVGVGFVAGGSKDGSESGGIVLEPGDTPPIGGGSVPVLAGGLMSGSCDGAGAGGVVGGVGAGFNSS